MSAPPVRFSGEGGMVTEGYLTQTLRLEGARGFRAAPPVRERGQEAAPTRAPIAGAGQGRSRNVPALMRPTRVLAALLSLSLLGLALPARAAFNALEEIPVESPIYRWVEDLATNYSLSTGLLL